MINTEKSAVAPKTATPKAKVSRIGRVKAAQLIAESKGRFYNATWTKANGDKRTMTCRNGVTKGVKGTGKVNTSALGLITVYDMIGKGFKKLNLQTLTDLKINKTIYKVK